ncbi:Clan CD, family C13, asparaginyl endopeptidase-like cysteine peptidase [Histomonas meleagridis]|uniref:Clan CD, family C13, asparaginyl endopeptidase-like cysteine peptidase n=1 Tax=Histomonas meleagridis TaxID=135588 RepID=UPI003559FCD3|nr:Clan CD, family C13, asparaginyl endopeptidase-like cysteine peptidase [Histomonas meleagridis]KAH0797734.1 Clan CD, family C13, asparaginyl endopeptidase-like cysteine peptidase [Histomonas meleagridis]
MLLLFLSTVVCDNWAVILTGGKGWTRYFESADSFYQYHLLIQNGFDKNKIILMDCDDIALSPRNMYPGQVFHNLNHSINVYPGSENIAYRGENVTSQNFYNVLLGNTSNGPALLSNEFDNVYIFYTGDRSMQFLTLPDENDYLLFDTLQKIIQQMSTNKKFKHLFFAISVEAFFLHGFSLIPNVYILTGAQGKYEFQDPILGNVYLTQEFPLTMSTFIETHPDGTFKDMIKYFKFYGSSINELSDLSMNTMKIAEFLCGQNKKDSKVYKSLRKIFASDEMEAMNDMAHVKNKYFYRSAVNELKKCKKFLSDEEYNEVLNLAKLIKYVNGNKIAEEIKNLC